MRSVVAIVGVLAIIVCLTARSFIVSSISHFEAERLIAGNRSASTEVQIADQGDPPFEVLATTSEGAPQSNVKIFRGVSDKSVSDAVGYFDDTAATNSSGKAMVKGPPSDLLLGIAPDGKVAVSFGGHSLSFGKVGTIRLTVTDGAGRPFQKRKVVVFPSPKSDPLRAFGWLDWGSFSPDPALTRTTDSLGRVEFPNLPVNTRFGVSLEVDRNQWMTYVGALRPGESGKVAFSNHCAMYGRVVNSKGKPLRNTTLDFGYPVHDSDPGGYSGPTLQTIKTDHDGRYQISGLPNIMLNIGGMDFHVDSYRFKPGNWKQSLYMVPCPLGRARCDLRASSTH